MSTSDFNGELDIEWIQLIKEVKELGVHKEEVLNFLKWAKQVEGKSVLDSLIEGV